MFRGISNLTVDSKGRIAVPTKHRDEISSDHGGEMMLTVDHAERCLVLYPMSQWEETEHKLMKMPNLSKAVRGMKRLILGHASEVEMDGQGRLMIAAPLREYAQMDKKVVLVGQGNKFELWDEETWNASREDMREAAPVNIENDESLKGLSI